MDPKEKPRIEVNYLYFLFLFLFLLFLTLSHFLRLSPPMVGAPLFFLLYAFGQSLLEVLLLMLIGYTLSRYTPKWVFKTFIGISFGFVLAHFANFMMVRLMDVTLSYFFKVFLSHSFNHIKAAFIAMNLNASMITVMVGLTILVPLIGIGFYWITQKASLKKPLALTQGQLLISAICLGLLLLILDITAQPYINDTLYRKYRKTLPLGSTFLAPKPHSIAMKEPISKLPEELEELPAISAKKRPNIYLFIIETLRKDFITPRIAPHLYQLDSPGDLTFANANATQLSWFSIFHSTYGWNWTQVRDTWKQGSLPLRLLKKMGYQIHVLSSSDFHYFAMDRILFGSKLELIDSIEDFSLLPIEDCERDRLAIQSLNSKQAKEGQLFIVFLNSTHSEYSSPDDFPRPLKPYTTKLDYFSLTNDPQVVQLLKNRYGNAVHWIDHLVGEFFKNLKEKGLYDEALCIFTGDHAEEFFEEGAIFHGTHLNDWQTKVPLCYKLPEDLPGPIATDIATHIDIFPTILHYLSGQEDWKSYFDGESLFASSHSPFGVCVQHNGSDVPYEFSLVDEGSRLIGRFINPPLIHTVPAIELLSLESRTPFPEEDALERFTGYFNLLVK